MIKRNIYSQIEPVLHTPEAVVITGMRRVGKTTLLRYIQKEIQSGNTLFLDLENPLNRRYFEEENYEKVLTSLQFLGLDTGKQGFVFLDEAQFVKQLPSVVKYLADHYPIKFFLSGSSSFYLKNHFSESLSGRKYIFELFPLSFSEFLRLKAPHFELEKIVIPVSEEIFQTIDRYYSEYLLYGGFPGVAQKTSMEEKKMMLEDIFSSYFQLEVIQLGDFRKTTVIRDLLLLLLERTGSKLDIQKLSRELGVARDTLNGYLDFLEDTYFIHRIRPMSRNRDAEIRGARKFYVCDTGIINRFARVDEGAIFENAIFLALRAKGSVNYFQKKSGVEIDFIVNKQTAYEVKISSDHRDEEKLARMAKEINVSGYSIISRKYTNLKKTIFGWMV